MPEDTKRGIIEAKVENFMGVKLAHIHPDGRPVFVIGGPNGAGKTGALNAIEVALAGLRGAPNQAIRRGEAAASIMLRTPDFVVTRILEAKGPKLRVECPPGTRVTKTPQGLLDSFYSAIGFDPEEFGRMEPAKQYEVLRDLVGLDFSGLDDERATKYDQRTDLNRQLKHLEGQLMGLAAPAPETPDEEVSVAELTAEQDARQHLAREQETTRQKLANLKAQIQQSAELLTQTENELRRLTEQRDRQIAQMTELGKQQGSLDAEISGFPPLDLQEIPAKIRAVELTNQAVRDKRQYAALVNQRDELDAQSKALTSRLQEIDAEKERALRHAKYPLKGLKLSAPTGVVYNEIPFSQLSSAERLKVSTAIGFALNPKLKLLIIRNGSLLDPDSLATLDALASDHGGQLLIERVGDGEEVHVVLEDGEVVRDEATADRESTDD